MSHSKTEEKEPLVPLTIRIPSPESPASLYLSSLSLSVENVTHSDSDSENSEPFSLLDDDHEFFLNYLFGKKQAQPSSSYQSDIKTSSTEVNPPKSPPDEDENHSSCCGFGLFKCW